MAFNKFIKLLLVTVESYNYVKIDYMINIEHAEELPHWEKDDQGEIS